MVIVTHEMAFARDVADTVVFMDKGVIVEQGDAKEVINNPKEERTKQFLLRYSQDKRLKILYLFIRREKLFCICIAFPFTFLFIN